ncbi:MAG: tetratricopeptide repeat protein [Candidatus Obscuribacter sp.]|nr:tetratricopeptide repeat protein [Candidatus Obscuribacter sp.]MBK9620655.1 tetratricopeptide repeat protein [Candidatus Obscuribacter sp.]
MQGDASRYLRHRQPVEAEKLYRQAIEVQEKLGVERLFESAITLAGLAKSLQMQHRYDEAEALFKKCLMKYCPACKNLDYKLKDLADCYAAQGRIVESRPFYKRAREVELQYKNLKAAMKMSDAADLLRVRRQFRKSESLYLKALAVTQKYSQPNSEQPEIMRGYAFLLSETGRKAEALELKGKAKHLMDEYYKVANVPTGLVMQ